MFDADKFLAARRPWVLHIGGRDYPAQPISVAAILDFQAAAQAAERDERAAALAVARLLRALFPWRVSCLWRGDPVRRLMRQGGPAVTAALTDFFDHLARMATLAPPTTSPIPPSVPRSPRNPSPAAEVVPAPV